MYFEQIYCPECAAVHWCETTRNNQLIICHGYNFKPRETPTHYTRRLGRGLEMVEKSKKQLPIAWEIAIEAREFAEI